MKSSLKGFPYTSSGISYIEAALAVPLLIYATIFTIDIARWIATKVVLQYAAYKGADIAQKIDITRNISEENCSSNPSDCAVHWNSAYQITYTAYNIASMIAGTDPERDSIVLYKWNHFDPSLMSSPNQSWNTMASGMETITYAGFIRPGEAVWEITPDNAHQTPIPNPARPYGTDHNQGFPNRFYNEDSRMYQKYPFAVMLKARVKTFTPFMPDWTASATVMSYASPSPGEGTPSSVSGSCGDNICEASELCSCQPDCAILCPQVGPSPSPSPTVTPSPSPSPSPTPTPTPSPSPTCGDGIVQNPPEECETDSDCLALAQPTPGAQIHINTPTICSPPASPLECKCIPDPMGAKCGDGIIQPPEECDTTPQGCALDEVCTSDCHCTYDPSIQNPPGGGNLPNGGGHKNNEGPQNNTGTNQQGLNTTGGITNSGSTITSTTTIITAGCGWKEGGLCSGGCPQGQFCNVENGECRCINGGSFTGTTNGASNEFSFGENER